MPFYSVSHELYVNIGKKGEFTGALVHSATGKMKLDIPEIEFEDLHLESKKSSFGFSSSFMPGKTNPMGGLGVSFDKSKQSEVVRTTFGPAEEIKTNSDISGLNRDLGAAHKKGSKKGSKGGIQLPTLDLEAMFQQARSVKSFFTALGTEVPTQLEGQAKASEVYRRLIAAGAFPQEALYLASRPSLCQKISSGQVDAIEGLALQRIAMRAKMPAEIAVKGSANFANQFNSYSKPSLAATKEGAKYNLTQSLFEKASLLKSSNKCFLFIMMIQSKSLHIFMTILYLNFLQILFIKTWKKSIIYWTIMPTK